MSVALRLADQADVARIADIHWSARSDAMPWLKVVHRFEDTVSWLREAVLPRQHVTVAVIEDAIAGYCSTSGNWIEQLYVETPFRGRGAGTTLLNEAVIRLKRPIQLYTFQKNASARAFYERRGFVAAAFGDGAWNEEREPDVRYALA